MRSSEKAKKIDMLADDLVKKFNSPESRPFFCKCGWKLSENQIWTAYEKSQAKGAKSPLRLFIYLCKMSMD